VHNSLQWYAAPDMPADALVRRGGVVEGRRGYESAMGQRPIADLQTDRELRRAVQRDAADAASGTGTPRREGEHDEDGQAEGLPDGDHVRQGSTIDEGQDPSAADRPAPGEEIGPESYAEAGPETAPDAGPGAESGSAR